MAHGSYFPHSFQAGLNQLFHPEFHLVSAKKQCGLRGKAPEAAHISLSSVARVALFLDGFPLSPFGLEFEICVRTVRPDTSDTFFLYRKNRKWGLSAKEGFAGVKIKAPALFGRGLVTE
jgi:hypothetical protein